MSAPAAILSVTLFPPGNPFGTDLFIKAEIRVEHFGCAEHIPAYNRPEDYDPGSGPEWDVSKIEGLFHDCGGEGEPVVIGPELSDALSELITSDTKLKEQVEEAIGKCASEHSREA